ncbi:MAG: hypothetical protein KDC79_13955 [Cyclobacteriaceae bacterium]|nr:hypothetical protein [Cyclobacteriaceae bacterium]
MAKKFKFSNQVEYNGILFDSTLECKYALSIEDYCDYYYHPLKIWYDKKDKTKSGKAYCNNSYEPDFLVRNLKTNKTYLVEIKDGRRSNYYDTQLKKFHALRYIEEKNKDWEYLLLTEKDFYFPSSKLNILKSVQKTIISTAGKKHMSNIHRKYSKYHSRDRVNKMPFKRHYSDLDELDYLHFIKTGEIRNRNS